MNKVKVGKFLSSKGYGTRKEIKKKISDNLVFEGDKIVNDFNMLVSPQNILIEGKSVDFYNKINIVINKPRGYECSRVGENSIFKLLPKIWLKRIKYCTVDQSIQGIFIN